MSDGGEPEEIYLLRQIRRFGAVNVLGRPMSALEIQRIEIVEGIVSICHDRDRADMKAEWETSNPKVAATFKYAAKLALDMGLVKDPD